MRDGLAAEKVFIGVHGSLSGGPTPASINVCLMIRGNVWHDANRGGLGSR